MKPQLMRKKYLKEIVNFYFAPRWQSAPAIFYLLFFLYFAVFYSGNIWLAAKFIYYTILNSGTLLGLPYLFWGVVFLIALIIPFSISLYAILLLYEVWTHKWVKTKKMLFTLAILILVPFMIVLMDDTVRLSASKQVLRTFVVENHLNLSGK